MGKTMQHSSTCSAGSWELSVRDGAQKKLNYWSSDWKYRFAGFRLSETLFQGTTPTLWESGAGARSQDGRGVVLMEIASL